MLNVSRQWLIKLLENGAMPVSSIPRSAKPEISNIHEAGFIKWERSGAGAKYSVINEDAMRSLLESTGYDGDLDELTPKARAVALHGDAHKGKDDSLLLLLSASNDKVIWHNGSDELDLYNYSSRFGVASLIAKPCDNWSSNQPIALVENLDLLIHAKNYFEKIGFNGTVLYYSGMISGKLLLWLNEKKRGTSYIMFPDYDIVGLNNYIRSKDRLGDMLSLYIPNNFTKLLAMHGKKNIPMKSQPDKTRIEKSQHDEVIKIYRAILETGRTLHQEGLMLN